MLYLRGRRYIDLAVIARGLNVSKRTVYRDIQALEEAGWPVPTWRHFADGADDGY